MAKQEIAIKTQDGTARAGLFQPSHRPASEVPGVILYMDAFGPRPALDAMAERLASEGYVVLLPDLFYRYGDYGPFDAQTAFSEEPSRTALRGMIGDTTQDMTRRDSAAFLDALTQAGATGRIGTVGYCMGGSRAINAAAAYPDRIAAAASFQPEQSAVLAQALRRAEIDHVIENYVGMAHGWAVPDSRVYDARGAERHWKRLLTFFDETLR
ncbi:dienelactone hydrolase family protein [Microvirga sp. CF3062]|uniref:dienelactone hydrolase family protein n=1 Tax=Microvirga sp. CF3062 TaxID=3110182 RepID=UPI002E77D320|nr:dienelactone hydrolase family protein [Microvirga sp. CF3062]MEE1655939.1 dienelactone hydrolase family protein [Microvirga sp. CF3062]